MWMANRRPTARRRSGRFGLSARCRAITPVFQLSPPPPTLRSQPGSGGVAAATEVRAGNADRIYDSLYLVAADEYARPVARIGNPLIGGGAHPRVKHRAGARVDHAVAARHVFA